MILNAPLRVVRQSVQGRGQGRCSALTTAWARSSPAMLADHGRRPERREESFADGSGAVGAIPGLRRPLSQGLAMMAEAGQGAALCDFGATPWPAARQDRRREQTRAGQQKGRAHVLHAVEAIAI